MVRNILYITLFISTCSFAQKDFYLKDSSFVNYYLFMNSDNNVVLVQRELFVNDYDRENFSNYSLIIFSAKDGSVLEKISIDQNVWELFSLNISHDGSYCTTVSKDELPTLKNFSEKWYLGPFTIREYSLKDHKCLWEQKWPGDRQSLGLTYSKNDKQIEGVSIENTIIIESGTGKIIKKSDKIAGINDFSKFMFDDITKDGKYFTFWALEYLEWSSEDETIILRLLDLGWYGLRWLYHLGSIPHFLYVWDVYNDSLYCKYDIPFEMQSGRPVFTPDASKLLLEPQIFNYNVYDIEEKKLLREFKLGGSNIPKEPYNPYPGPITISPDEKYFAEVYGDNILIIDFNKGQIIENFERETLSEYAMQFSSDSKYFTLFTKRYDFTTTPSQKFVILELYNTTTWQKVWERDLTELEAIPKSNY